MSFEGTLLADYEETVCFMDKKTETVPDGYGGISGVRDIYVEGAEFIAAVTKDNSQSAQIAQAETEIKRYRITTKGEIALRQGDYIKRKASGDIYKILHDNFDKLAPEGSTLNGIRSTTMERVKLP